MDPSQDLDAAINTISSGGAAITGVARTDPDATIAWCPGWTVATVATHIGNVHGWAAEMVRSASQERLPFAATPEGLSSDELADWADNQRAALIDAFAGADPDQPMWAFGQIVPSRFWWRRQTHETAVHAWDATFAAGQTWQIDGDTADDGLAELLSMLPFIWRRNPPAWGDGRTVHFHRTDGDGERVLTIGSPPVVELGHRKGDLAVRGPAADLLLWALNRPSSAECLGDTALAEAWAANVKL